MRLSEMQTVPAPDWARKHPEAQRDRPPPVGHESSLQQYEAFPTLFHWHHRTIKSAYWHPYGEPFTLPTPREEAWPTT
jgi:hypothetical protein